MNTGSGALKNKVVNTLFKSWSRHRAKLDFPSKTFNELWKERKGK